MSEEHAGLLYFYSESAGLAANAVCALVAALSNFGIELSDQITGVCFVAIGGAIQLGCSLRSYRAYDHFGGSVFGFFSAFWVVVGLEILTNTDIGHLYILLLLVNVLLWLAAPFVNAFYSVIIGSITVMSSLELAKRFSDDDPTLTIAAGVSEVIVCLIALYGALNEVLHGLHGNHVLPGFQDAVIETVLWKRKPLKTAYADGKWGDPKALQLFCAAMGFAALWVKQEVILYAIERKSICCWLATFAGILWMISFVHALRGEQFLSVSATVHAGLFAISAYDSFINPDDGDDDSGVTEASLLFYFASVYLLLLCHSAFQRASAIDLLTFCSISTSLVVGGVQASNPTKAMATASLTIFVFAVTLTLYNGIASLVNAIVQKIVFPIGPQFYRISNRRFLRRNIKKWAYDFTSSAGTHKTANSLDSSENSVDDIDEEIIAPSFTYPNDEKLLGQSDFKTPLHVLFTGLAIYSAILSMSLLINSGVLFHQALFLNIMIQGSVIVICVSRGQTSFGFLSFTYILGSVLLADESSISGGMNPIWVAQIILQSVWLVSSFRVFYLLSGVTILHMAATSCLLSPSYLIAAAIFAIMAVTSFTILAILLGCEYFQSCKRLIQVAAPDLDESCEIGFATDRNEFDRCIEIIREGGVVCIPTDTVYCLACAANRPDAIKRIYDIKNRPSEKPLSLWLGSIEDIRKVGPTGKGWGRKLMMFMEAIWPGSVSLVVSRGEWLNRMGIGDAANLIGTPDSIALRVPNSTLTVALLRETGPLAITSANPSGACDCTHHNKVDKKIAAKIDYILADGSSPMTIASSVVDVRDIEEEKLFFYRVGCVPETYIWNKLRWIPERTPVLLGKFASPNQVRLAQNLMTLIAELMNCETWHMFLPCPRGDERASQSWSKALKMHSHVISSFETGVSYYDSNELLSGEEGNRNLGGDDESPSSELIVPVIKDGRICAVLQLLDKMDSSGHIVSFTSRDVHTVQLACNQISDMVETSEVGVEKSKDSAATCNNCSLSAPLGRRGYGSHPNLKDMEISTAVTSLRRGGYGSQPNLKDMEAATSTVRAINWKDLTAVCILDSRGFQKASSCSTYTQTKG